jgi:hypothetical protein
MFRGMCLGIRTWTIMVHGGKSLTTGRCGTRALWMSDGLRIVPDIGTGLALGAGLGSIMLLGALHRITMDVGRLSAGRGAGALVRFMRVRSMGRLSWGSSAADLDSESDLAAAGVAESAGSRWASANRFIRGITPAETISAT